MVLQTAQEITTFQTWFGAMYWHSLWLINHGNMIILIENVQRLSYALSGGDGGRRRDQILTYSAPQGFNMCTLNSSLVHEPRAIQLGDTLPAPCRGRTRRPNR